MKKILLKIVIIFSIVIFSKNTILNPNCNINYHNNKLQLIKHLNLQSEPKPALLKLVLTTTNLGEIGPGKDVQPTEDEIKAAIKIKNENINIEKILLTHISKKGVLVEGDDNFYSGSVYVSFTTKNFVKLPFTFKGKINTLIVNTNEDIFFISNGKVYKSSYERNYISYEEISGTSNKYDVLSLACDSGGNIYAGDSFGNIFKCLFTSSLFKLIISIEPMVKVDKKGNIYAGTWDGVYQSNSTNSFKKMLGINGKILALTCNNNNIYALNEEPPLFSVKNNIYKFSDDKNCFKLMKIKEIDNAITMLVTNSTNNNIYAASNKGVYQSNGTDDFELISKSKKIITALTIDIKGNVYATSNEKEIDNWETTIYYKDNNSNIFNGKAKIRLTYGNIYSLITSINGSIFVLINLNNVQNLVIFKGKIFEILNP